MNEKKVLEIIDKKITNRLISLVEGMSDNEFIEELKDEVYNETGEDLTDMTDELSDLVGDRMLPLLHKFGEYVTEIEIPK